MDNRVTVTRRLFGPSYFALSCSPSFLFHQLSLLPAPDSNLLLTSLPTIPYRRF
ncbi:hypothetical protein IE53DRAFT_389796 [Violaceomyces palustris]|uniref:Uncharacterized protein n=1 Tax=Violaceomyces palustris TaxID=1673888 RepID=A0ACD0NQF5_9BASI|nr:hypothetical protein IE53DRAFT_389796 [Violaceomyces palustris]